MYECDIGLKQNTKQISAFVSIRFFKGLIIELYKIPKLVSSLLGFFAFIQILIQLFVLCGFLCENCANFGAFLDFATICSLFLVLIGSQAN